MRVYPNRYVQRTHGRIIAIALLYARMLQITVNPPFSILARICRFYQARGVPFLLFAPTLTLFSAQGTDVSYLPCGISITYANGAKVNTSFVTNLDDCRLRTVPELYRLIREANDKNEKAMTKTLPKYRFPPHVLTAAAAYQLGKYGQTLRIERGDAVFIRSLDAMRARGRDAGIFGGAYLLSERAAAERAAAERAAAERAAAERAAAEEWALSEREKAIVAGLGDGRAAGAVTASLGELFDLDYLMEGGLTHAKTSVPPDGGGDHAGAV